MRAVKRLVVSLLLMVACQAMVAQDWGDPEFEALVRTYIKQSFQVTGKVYGVDEFEPEPYPLQGANIKVTCLGDTTAMEGMAADKDGSFWVYLIRRDRIKDTRLRVVVSYLGMQTFDSIFAPKETKENGQQIFNVQLDSLVLHSNPLTTQEVEIVAELQRMYQRGDTTIFNVDAYEMPTGSVLLDLVRRLPGLKYEDGKMKYMDRDIEEIRLNGDSFFKRDMSIALNNMPTEKLKSLKVYEVLNDTLNVMSDNHLIMDMETKEPVDATLFSYAGVGTTEHFDKYVASVNFSIWNKSGTELYTSFDRRTIPYNYSDQLKSENTYGNIYLSKEIKDLTINANGGYNEDYSENKSVSYNKMFMPEFTQNSYSENSSSSGSNNWNGNTGVSGKIAQKVWVDLTVNYSQGRSYSDNMSIDSISNEGEGLISSTEQTQSSRNRTESYGLNGSMSGRFGKDDKYYFNAGMNVNRSNDDGTSINKSESHFMQLGDSVRNVDHRIYTPNKTNSYGFNMSVNRDLGKEGYSGTVSLGYNFSYSDGKSEQSYEDVAADGTLTQVDSLYYDKRNSNMRNRMNLSYNYSDSLYRVNLSGNMEPVVMTIDNLNRMPNRADEHLRYMGVRWNANADFRVRLFKTNYIGLGYRGSNGLPSIDQLSTVTDYSNPMYIREGNSALKNSFTHNVSMEYQFKSWVRATVNYGFTTDQITTLTRLNKQTGVRVTSPTNIDGNWNVSEYIFFTYPFRDISLSFNVNNSLNHNVAYVQSFTDDDAQKSSTDYRLLSLNLTGAYSDKHWILSANAGYSRDRNKSDYLENTNGGERLSAVLNLSYEMDCGLECSTSFSYSQPFGYEMESANRAEYLCDMGVDYSFLKKRNAMVSIEWRDILNSYNGFSANVSGTSWSESRTFGDNSMFLITFSYRFDRFE